MFLKQKNLELPRIFRKKYCTVMNDFKIVYCHSSHFNLTIIFMFSFRLLWHLEDQWVYYSSAANEKHKASVSFVTYANMYSVVTCKSACRILHQRTSLSVEVNKLFSNTPHFLIRTSINSRAEARHSSLLFWQFDPGNVLDMFKVSCHTVP